MNFSCEKSILNSALQITARASASKSTMPQLEGLLIEVGSNVKITGYDLKKGIYTHIDATVHERGSIILNAKLFTDIVRSLPDGMVTMTCDENCMCNIVCGQSNFNIMGMDSKDYPELPEVDYESSISISQEIIKKMINETMFCVSDNESRPVYTGALFDIQDGKLTVVSVDGFRLALRKESIDTGEMDGKSFIVPGDALRELEKICVNPTEMVKITLGSKHISFVIDNIVLISRRLEGEFLDYKKSIPSEFTVKVKAVRTDLCRIVDRVSLLIMDDKQRNPLRCVFEDNIIRFFCVTALGKAEDACLVQGDGKEIEIGFNNRYLRDAFKAAPADEILLCLNSGTTPCVILPDEGDSFLYMILPVRLK